MSKQTCGLHIIAYPYVAHLQHLQGSAPHLRWMELATLQGGPLQHGMNSKIDEVEVRIILFAKNSFDHMFLAYVLYTKKTFMVPIILGLSWSLYESTLSYLERCCWNCYVGLQSPGNDPNGLPLTLDDTSTTYYIQYVYMHICIDEVYVSVPCINVCIYIHMYDRFYIDLSKTDDVANIKQSYIILSRCLPW